MIIVWAIIHVLMLAMDVAWWVIAMRLTKTRWARILAGTFIGAQTVAHLSLMCGLNWRPYSPQFLYAAVIMWHFFGLGLLGLLGIVWWCARVARSSRRDRPPSVGISDPSTARIIPLTRRDFVSACAALAPPLFNIGSTAVALWQMDQLRVRRFALSIPSLPRALDGVTIAHVSDLHVGGMTSSRVLREMVNITNSLRADLVLLTGDLINYELADLSEGLSLVKALEARHGLWMIEGNHDRFENAGEFERRVRAAGVPFLVNESAVAQVRGFPVQLFGLGWMGGGFSDRDREMALQVRIMMRQRQPDAFPILLAHHPHAFDGAVEADLPLTLSGHTHGGFWMLDQRHGVGPSFFRYWTGLYARGRSQMIVSNGIGNWNYLPPVRLNAPAEIVHLTLRSTA